MYRPLLPQESYGGVAVAVPGTVRQDVPGVKVAAAGQMERNSRTTYSGVVPSAGLVKPILFRHLQ